ncbi:TIGR01457 family HAD-type hydrolase [Thalassobacillus sp. CUG 92003]|uniref:TIGR01457 family HAD-type hydrolase n=1 Tax=Thalassobacillus sp. CUG 92003 TaxID=2736641 RepID=UPI0015E705BE|nr:TIGR01457 family HAD-type hydrolase [Thalassobacillus sp. CUG 92003]
MNRYKAMLIDLDGTMYRGTEAVEGAKEFIEYLRASHIPFLFVTNNSSKTPAQVAGKLRDLNISAHDSEIFTSSMATAKHIRDEHPGARVYAIGETGLYEALSNEGLTLTEDAPDIVVTGIDRQMTYDKFAKACVMIRKGAMFLSTNGDTSIPTDQGMLPGNGAFNAVISVSTGVTPQIIGKPESMIIDQALDVLNCPKDDVLLVGDNYHTDILAGINAGIDTLMVLTGVTQFNHLSDGRVQPTYVMNNLSEWVNTFPPKG